MNDFMIPNGADKLPQGKNLNPDGFMIPKDAKKSSPVKRALISDGLWLSKCKEVTFRQKELSLSVG